MWSPNTLIWARFANNTKTTLPLKSYCWYLLKMCSNPHFCDWKGHFCSWHYCISICTSFTLKARNLGKRIFKYKCDLLRFASCNITADCFEFNAEQKHILFRLDVVVTVAPRSVPLFGEGGWLKGVSVIPKLLSCHVILVSPHTARLGPSPTHFWIWIIWLFCNGSQI